MSGRFGFGETESQRLILEVRDLGVRDGKAGRLRTPEEVGATIGESKVDPLDPVDAFDHYLRAHGRGERSES